jgi:hypothetical protein
MIEAKDDDKAHGSQQPAFILGKIGYVPLKDHKVRYIPLLSY